MDKNEIQQHLQGIHEQFANLLTEMDDSSYRQAPDGKWNAGQQLSHVIKSIKAIHKGMALPKYQMKLLFGVANRPSRSYEDLVMKYQEKLSVPYKAPKTFLPNEVPYEEREAAIGKLLEYASKISHRLDKFSEEDLEKYVLPHPLLGKLTLREMAYFTSYHCAHHHDLTRTYSGGQPPRV